MGYRSHLATSSRGAAVVCNFNGLVRPRSSLSNELGTKVFIFQGLSAWYARRAVAFAAISMTCRDGRRNKVRFQPIGAFQSGNPSYATTRGSPHLTGFFPGQSVVHRAVQ